jgi:hypothetical protein
VSVGVYAVAWIVSTSGLALLGEATRRAGEVFGARVATWGVLLAVIGNLGVWTLETGAARGRLYAGDDFTQVAGRARQRFAQFSPAVRRLAESNRATKDAPAEGTPQPRWR